MTVFNSIWGGGVDLSGITDGNLPLVSGGEFVDSPALYDGEDFFVDLGTDANTEISLTASLFTFNHTGGNNAFKIITDESANYKYAIRIATGAGTFGMFADGDLHASEINLDGGKTVLGDIWMYKDGSLGNAKQLTLIEANFIDNTEASYTSRLSVSVGDYAYTHREALRIDTDGSGVDLWLGDVAGGNTTEIEADGTLKFNGDATVYNDVYPSAVSVGVGSAGPSFTAYAGNMRAYEFLGAATTKELFMQFQLPHDRKDGSDISPHIHLHIPDDATGGIVKFSCEYHWENVNDTGAVSTTTVSGTVTRGASAGIAKNIILAFPDITGTGYGISSILSCRIYRDPGDAGDTFGASVWLKSADVHIEIDTIGSRAEYTK